MGHDWLTYDNEKGVMTCSVCIQNGNIQRTSNLKGQNKFLEGCSNFRISTILDHETSTSHKAAVSAISAKVAAAKSGGNLRSTEAGKAYLALKQAERTRLLYLFRNIHAVMKNNRPITDYKWLCQLDLAKGLDIGHTYFNNKAALQFVKAIAAVEIDKTVEMINAAPFFSVMMDGSTDITGDEQEAVYVRMSYKGKPIERFLGIGSPVDTTSKQLEVLLLEMLTSFGIDTGILKLILLSHIILGS